MATVTGPRSTVTARVQNPDADAVAQPFVKVEDVSGSVPLRSRTETGSAHFVPQDETLPYLRQDQVPEGVPQASCTPLGQATPLIDGSTVISSDPQVIAEAQKAQKSSKK